ncbi:MAG: hypothetical protein FJ144_07555 [Deltaproteobacteria bacterium]|nr:hypothetical protein [Deltaproteobacteria bacterium]
MTLSPVSPSQPHEIRWSCAYALATLQLVVTLGWLAYAHFHAKLAEHFGFAALSGFLSLYLGIAGATLAPVVGEVGDRIVQRSGNRFPVLVTGALLAGATFVSVALTVTATPSGFLGGVLLVLMLIWIAAMAILQAPALALLPAVATQAGRWPAVASPLVVATVLPLALWPLVRMVLDGLGGTITFLAGGVLVVASTFWLRRVFTAEASAAERAPTDVEALAPASGAILAIVLFVGMVSAFVTRLASDVVPSLLASRLGSGAATPSLLAAAILGSGTVLAPTLSGVGLTFGTRFGVLGSAAIAAGCAAVAPLCTSIVAALAVAIVLGGAMAVHLDCALPFALGSLPLRRAGLSAGLYLGGVFAGSQLASLVPLVAASSGGG